MSQPPLWWLVKTPRAEHAIQQLPPQTKRYVRYALDELRQDPLSGKSLRDELAGLYSFKAKRFRIVYRLEHRLRQVTVLAVGPRNTIYDEMLG